MKSKKLNKLARRGLTAALAASMALSMAAPMATTALADVGQTKVTNPNKNNIGQVTVNLYGTKSDNGTLSESLDGKTVSPFTFIDSKKAESSDFKYTDDLYVKSTSKESPATQNNGVSYYKIEISGAADLIELNGTAKDQKALKSKKESEYVWTFTKENNAKSNLEEKGVTVQTTEAANKKVSIGDTKEATVTVYAYGEDTSKPIGQSSVTYSITNRGKISTFHAAKVFTDPENANVTVDDKTGTVSVDKTESKNVEINMELVRDNKDGYQKEAAIGVPAEKYVISGNTHPEYATVSNVAEIGRSGKNDNSNPNLGFTITAKKSGTTTISITRRAYYSGEDGKKDRGYEEYTYTFDVTVTDTSAGLTVAYKTNGNSDQKSVSGYTSYEEAMEHRGNTIFLDIVKNTSMQINAKSDYKIDYYVVSSDRDQLVKVTNSGLINVIANAFSFTNDETSREATVIVKATNTSVKNGKTEYFAIPVWVGKTAATYINVTNAEENENKSGVFDSYGYYTRENAIPVYSDKDSVTQYYRVPTEIEGFKWTDASLDGNVNKAKLNTAEADYFYQMSTVDEKKWRINRETNDAADYVTYHSSNPNVADVDNDGYVIAKAKGSAIIYITAKNSGDTYQNITRTININVTDKNKYNTITTKVDSIVLNAVEDSKEIGASVKPAKSSDIIYGLYKKNDDGTYTAYDSDGDGYADTTAGDITVDPNGKVTYRKTGKTSGTVYVGIGVKPNDKSLNTTTNGKGGVDNKGIMKYIPVTYSEKRTNAITVDGTATTSVGNTVDVTATTTTPGTFAVESSDETVAKATVDAAGKITITGVKAGKATIKVSNTATDTTYANPADKTIEVTVTNNTLTVTPESIAFDKIGDTTTITPTTDAKGGVTYTSEDPSVATVDAAGKVTAVKAGTTNIVVTAGTQTVKVPVAVKATETTTVIKKDTTTVKVKKPTNFKAKNVKTRSIKITAKKNGTITGFKVKYTPVGKPYDEKTVKGNKNLNTTIKGLKKGVTYKVKVQAYRKVKNGKTTTVFSKNTKVIKVKITK